jgi:hypothetical protein
MINKIEKITPAMAAPRGGMMGRPPRDFSVAVTVLPIPRRCAEVWDIYTHQPSSKRANSASSKESFALGIAAMAGLVPALFRSLRVRQPPHDPDISDRGFLVALGGCEPKNQERRLRLLLFQ